MAQRGKINEFFDVQEFEKQRAQVVKGVQEYITLVEAAPEIRVQIKNTDSIKAANDGLTKLNENNKKVVDTTTQVYNASAKLESTQKAVNKTLNDAAKGADAASESYQVLLKASAQNTIISDKLRAQVQDLKKARQAGLITEDAYINKLAEVKEQQTAITVSNTQINAGLKALEKSYQSSAGSLDQLNATLNVLKLGYRGLSEEEKKSPIGVKAQKEIEALTDDIREQEKKIGDFSKNVGRYAESLAGGFEAVSRELARLKREQADLEGGPGGPEQEEKIKRVTEGIRELTDIQRVSLDTGKSYTQNIRQLDQEFINLVHSGNTSKEFQEQFKQFLADSKRETADLKKEIKAIGSETKALDGVASAFSAIVSGAEAAYGISALLSGQNEEQERTIKKLIAVQSVANGVREFAKQLTEKETVVGKAYIAVQKQMQILFGQGATAAMRFGVALKSIAVLAVVAVLVDIAEKIGLLGDAEEETTKYTDKLTASFKKQDEQLQDLNATLDTQLKLRIEKLKSNADAIKDINDRAYEDELKTKEEQLDNIKEREKQALDERAKNEEYFQIARRLKNGKFTQEELKTLKETSNLLNENVRKAQDEREKKEQDILLFTQQNTTRLNDLNRKQVENELKAQNEIRKIRLESAADAKREFAEISLFGEGGRIKALQDEYKLRKQVIVDGLALELELNSRKQKEEQYTAGQRLALQAKANDEIHKLDLKLANDKIRINIEELTKRRELNEQIAEDAATALQETHDQALAALERELANEEKLRQRAVDFIDRDESDRVIRLNAKYKKELKAAGDNYEERARLDRNYQADRLEIENKFNLERLNAELASQKRLLNTQDLTKEQREEALRKIAELEKQISDASVKNTEDANKRKKESDDAYYDNLVKRIKTTGEIFSNVIQTVGELGSIGIDRENATIEENLTILEKKKEKDIEVVNASVLSEKDKADKLAVIEATANAKKEALERRKRQLETERAKFEKAANIARIVTETAAAVVTTLGDKTIIPGFLRIPLAVTIGALGAAQLARAIATPLPKYRHGKPAHDNYEGWSVVGDGGRAEAIIRGDGRVDITPAKPTYAWVGRDDVVLSSVDKLAEAMGGMSMNLPEPYTVSDYAPALIASNKAVAQKLDLINRTIANKREVVFERPPVMDRIVKQKAGNKDYYKMNGFEV